MSKPSYYCAICEKPAAVVDGLVVRACAHSDGAVIAPRTSVLYGAGGASVRELSPLKRALVALLKALS